MCLTLNALPDNLLDEHRHKSHANTTARQHQHLCTLSPLGEVPPHNDPCCGESDASAQTEDYSVADEELVELSWEGHEEAAQSRDETPHDGEQPGTFPPANGYYQRAEQKGHSQELTPQPYWKQNVVEQFILFIDWFNNVPVLLKHQNFINCWIDISRWNLQIQVY